MIPGSLYRLLTLSILFLSLESAGMEKKGLPASPSKMAFPAPKPDAGKQSGSMIGRVIKRTTSLLSITDRATSEELQESTSSVSPRISGPIAAEELKRSSRNSVQIKKELVFGKPLYTITYNNVEETASIDGSCLAQYRVNSLIEFKKDNTYLRRIEVLEFINRILRSAGKSCIDGVGHNIGTKDKEICAKAAYHHMRSSKHLPDFNKTFYVVSLKEKPQRVCVFESDIKEK